MGEASWEIEILKLEEEFVGPAIVGYLSSYSMHVTVLDNVRSD